MTWEYIAGFFDGEGCVHLSKRGGVVVSIGQAAQNGPILQMIQAFLADHEIGSKIRERKPKDSRFDTQFNLTIQEAVATCRFLKNLLPFLFVKRDKAVSAIGICTRIIDKKSDHASRIASACEEYARGAALHGTRVKYRLAARVLKRELIARGIPFRNRNVAARAARLEQLAVDPTYARRLAAQARPAAMKRWHG